MFILFKIIKYLFLYLLYIQRNNVNMNKMFLFILFGKLFDKIIINNFFINCDRDEIFNFLNKTI